MYNMSTIIIKASESFVHLRNISSSKENQQNKILFMKNICFSYEVLYKNVDDVHE